MAYFENDPAGSTGISASAPIVLATDHTWPIPSFSAPLGNYCVSGCTGITNTAPSTTVIPAPSTGFNLYVSSIQVTAVGTGLPVISFKPNNASGNFLCFLMPPSLFGMHCVTFQTPLKVGNASLFASTFTNSASFNLIISAQGVYLPI